MVYQQLARKALFRIGGGDPEVAHERTLAALARLGRLPPVVAGLRRYFGPPASGGSRTVFGVRFDSPVGLAAGMDKNGVALPAWPALGFGHVEAGTVTWHPQPGNPKPRLYRLPASGALVNRMGFNNEGAMALAARLERLGPLPVPLGISIGKSKATPLGEAVADYLHSVRALDRYADYLAVNVSSPNTPGLRSLQDKGALTELLAAVRAETRSLAATERDPTPVLVKIAPDLTDHAVAELLDVCRDHGIAGVIAANTSTGRDGVAAADSVLAQQTGGLSGPPLANRACELVRFVHEHTEGTLPIIGCGGITSLDDARRMFDSGASLLQLFTGLIYAGPWLLRAINRARLAA